MSWPRRRRSLLALLLLLLALLAAGYFPQEPLRRLVENRLRAALGPDARIGSLHVVPALLRADLSDVQVRSPSLDLDLPHVRVQLSYAALRGSWLAIETLELESPRIALRSAGAGSGAAHSLAQAVIVRRVALRGGALSYAGPSGRLELAGIEAHGGVGLGTLELRASGGTFQNGTRLALGPVEATLSATPRLELELERLTAQAGQSSLSASGTLGSVLAPRLALTLEGRLELADAARLAGRSDLDGQLAMHARLEGPPAEAAVTGEAKGGQLSLAGWPVRDAVLALKRAAGPQAPLDIDLAAALAGGRAHLQAKLAGELLDTRIDASGLDAEALRSRLAPDAGPLRGSGDLQARLRGPFLKWLTVVVDAQTRLELGGQNVATRLHSEGQVDTRDGNVDLRWSAANSSLPVLPQSPLQGLTLEISGTATGRRGANLKGFFTGSADLSTGAGTTPVPFEGQLHATGGAWTLDATAAPRGGQATLAAAAQGTTFERLSLQVRDLQLGSLVADGRGTLLLNLDAHGPLASLDGTFSGQGADVAVAGADVGAATLAGRLAHGQTSFDLALPQLGASLTGSSDGKRATADVRLEELPLERLAPAREAGLQGKLSGEAHLEGPLGKPASASVDARVGTLQLLREPWSLAAAGPFELRLRDGRLQVEQAHLTGSGLDLQVDGRVDLRARSLQARVQAAATLSELPPQAEWQRQGRVQATLALSGEWNRPRVEGELTTEGVVVAGPGLAPVQLDDTRAVLHDRQLELPGVVARVAGGSASLQGRVPLAALLPAWRRVPALVADDEAAALELGFEGIDTARLRRSSEPGLPEDADELQSHLAGRLSLRGGLASLSELTGHLSIPATTVQLGETALSTSDLELSLSSGHLALSGVELKTPNGQLTVHGNVDLGRRELTAIARGAVELRALSPLLSEAALTGLADVDLEVRGPWAALRPSGTLKVADGSLRLRMLGQAITGLRSLLVFEDGLLRVERLDGELGGGTLSTTGQARIARGGLADVDLRLVGKDVALRYPMGMRSRLNTELAFTGRTEAFSLAGGVDVQRAEYDLDAVLDTSLFAGATRATRSPLLRSIGLGLEIRLLNPARVASRRNGFENVLAQGNLRLLGDLETPLPYGRLELLPRGLLQVRGRPFRIETGSLTYDASWDAALSLEARLANPIRLTGGEGCDRDRTNEVVGITARLSGTLALPEASFRSDELADDAEALSLLASGRCGGDFVSAGGRLADAQLSLLSDRLTSRLRGGLGSLGLDEVTIEPQLVAKDDNPGARFTFGKRLTPFTRLVYSTALNRPDDKYVRLDFGPWHTLAASAKRRSDGKPEATLGQRIEWGGAARSGQSAPEERVRLTDVALAGELGAPEPAVRKALGVRPRQRMTEWQLLDRADGLRDWLREQGFLEAEVGAQLDGQVARVQVRSGPRYAWQVLGSPSPSGFDRIMYEALFEDEALDRGRERLLRDLRRQGHLRADVRAHVKLAGGVRTLVFESHPGPVLELLPPDIHGAVVISPGELLKLAGGQRAVAAEPEKAGELWQQAYRDAHHLAARIDGPRVLEAPGGVRIVASIEEGPTARLASLAFEGHTQDEATLRDAAGLQPPEPFDELRVADATLRLRNHYLGLGYARVRVVPVLEPVEADFALRLRIDEGPRVIIRDVRIEGAEHTRADILLSRSGLEAGRPLDPREVFAAERRLMSLGTLASARGQADDSGVVTLRVSEAPRYLAGYELAYEDERGLRGQVDAEVRNLFGRGLVLSGRYGRGADDNEGRAFLNMPLRHGLFTLSGSRLSENLEFNTRVQRELQAQQTFELTRAWKLLIAYRFKRVTVAPAFPEPIDVAGLQPSLIRDTRDNQLDTRSGRFYSLNLELDGRRLGSDSSFAKGLLQARVFSTHGALTWAQGCQLGLGWGFAGRIRSTERFQAGGPNSVRGFALNGLGPLDLLGAPAGGEAVLVLNQELRFRHSSGLGAALFYDAGNVFDRAADFDFKLRHAVGVGARYASPVGLLRLDVGFPLARRTGERSYRLYFNLGQAF